MHQPRAVSFATVNHTARGIPIQTRTHACLWSSSYSNHRIGRAYPSVHHSTLSSTISRLGWCQSHSFKSPISRSIEITAPAITMKSVATSTRYTSQVSRSLPFPVWPMTLFHNIESLIFISLFSSYNSNPAQQLRWDPKCDTQTEFHPRCLPCSLLRSARSSLQSPMTPTMIQFSSIACRHQRPSLLVWLRAVEHPSRLENPSRPEHP